MSKTEELTLEEQVERIRRKRQNRADYTQVRLVLNTAFLILAAIGLAVYFLDDSHHIYALVIIGIGMLLKMVEFFIRFIL